MQACHWTGDCVNGSDTCANKCVANLFPVRAAGPASNGASFANDMWYAICPEIALTVQRAQSGWFSASAVAPASRRSRALRFDVPLRADDAVGSDRHGRELSFNAATAKYGLVRKSASTCLL